MTDAKALSKILYQHYGVSVDKTVTLKSVTGIVGVDRSRWIWKRAQQRDTEVRLASLHAVTEHLEQAGIQCAGPVPAKGQHFLVPDDHSATWGYLQKWYPGRHVDLGKDEERLLAVAALAQLHQHSMSLPHSLKSQLRTGNLLRRLRRKQQAMHESWPVAKGKLPQLAALETLVWQGIHRALTRLALWEPPGNLVFCHRDLAPHNILFQELEASDEETKIAFVDFDQSGYDKPYLDLLQIANHALYFTDVGPGYFHELLQTYDQHAETVRGQEGCLWDLFFFPDLLIRSTIEWVAQGCPDKGKAKVLLSAAKEEMRWSLLRDETSRYRAKGLV